MFGDVVDLTGSRRLTRNVFKALQQTLNATGAEYRSVQGSIWSITKSKLVNDVLVLPGLAFASSMKTKEKTDVVTTVSHASLYWLLENDIWTMVARMSEMVTASGESFKPFMPLGRNISHPDLERY